jgi:hypothetical protein
MGGGGGGAGRGGFIFLSANRRVQGALLLFLSNYRGTGKNFFIIDIDLGKSTGHSFEKRKEKLQPEKNLS